MPTYVTLIHWTDQGIKNYKDTTSRAEDFTKLVENKGGRVRELLWTVGEYDLRRSPGSSMKRPVTTNRGVCNTAPITCYRRWRPPRRPAPR